MTDSSNFKDDKSKVPTEAELEAMLDEESDDEFGQSESEVAAQEQRAVLKEWTAQDFASIYTRFRPHLERHARRFLRNPSQVDEVVQDAFLYLMVTLPELDSELGVLRFLKWKVRLLCLDVIRVGSRAYHADLEEHQEFLASDDEEMSLDLERAEDAAIVRMALAKLQPRQREVLVASIYEEKSTLEIAEQVGLSENATRQLMHRARTSLKKALIGEADTSGLSLGQILSVAALKAAHDAKNVGVQAMSVAVIAVVGLAAFLNFGSFTPASQLADSTIVQPEAAPIEISPQGQAAGSETAPEAGLATDPEPAPTTVPGSSGAATTDTAASTDSEVALVSEEAEVSAVDQNAGQNAQPVQNTAQSGALVTELALNNASIDRSPFDPWLVDRIFEDSGTASILQGGSLGQDISSRNQLVAISDAGVWADFSFDANGPNPISDVRVGFLADSNQFFSFTKKVDYLVSRTPNGLDLYTYVGIIQEISDLQLNRYSDTRMTDALLTLEILVDQSVGKVVDSSLRVQAKS
jgi:RNA polymerase sigma-70 factor (ECF subfamily)